MIPQKLKKIWNVTTTVILVLMISIVVLLVGGSLLGVKPYTVLSGSMEPNYPVGSLIFVRKVDPLTLQVHDPVTFYLNDHTVATHRIIEVIPDENDPSVVKFRTQGDNNDEADRNPVFSSSVIGKPILCIPYLGYVANFVQVPPGKYILLALCAVMLISVMLPSFKKSEEQEQP